jgi:hypothetical protein
MDDIQSGFQDIIVNVVEGIIVGAIFAAFQTIPTMEPYLWVFGIVGLVGFGIFVLAIPRWSIGYIAGWAFGVWVLSSSGLMHLEEILIYIVVPAIILMLKLYLFLKGESQS